MKDKIKEMFGEKREREKRAAMWTQNVSALVKMKIQK